MRILALETKVSRVHINKPYNLHLWPFLHITQLCHSIQFSYNLDANALWKIWNSYTFLQIKTLDSPKYYCFATMLQRYQSGGSDLHFVPLPNCLVGHRRLRGPLLLLQAGAQEEKDPRKGRHQEGSPAACLEGLEGRRSKENAYMPETNFFQTLRSRFWWSSSCASSAWEMRAPTSDPLKASSSNRFHVRPDFPGPACSRLKWAF